MPTSSQVCQKLSQLRNHQQLDDTVAVTSDDPKPQAGLVFSAEKAVWKTGFIPLTQGPLCTS